MTGETYRIEVVHDPHSDAQPWDAQVFKGEQFLATRWGATQDDALESARAWIRAETLREPGKDVYYVDGEGNDVATPLSAA